MNIYKVTDHKNHKQKLLNLIASIPKTTLKEHGTVDKISHTDWSLTGKQEYWKYFTNNILKTFGDYLCNTYRNNSFKITNGWFQQYQRHDTHGWHTHDNVVYSCIYYLEMPICAMKTEFKNPKNDKIETFNVEEGDILTFSSSIKHRSKSFKNNKRKTVIAFNIK